MLYVGDLYEDLRISFFLTTKHFTTIIPPLALIKFGCQALTIRIE